MSTMAGYVSMLKSKPVLIGVAALLLALNLFRQGVAYYHAGMEEVAADQAQLEQYRLASRDSQALEKRLDQLRKQEQLLEELFFTGESSEQIASTMQIGLQELIQTTGLALESLRPSVGSDKGAGFGEISLDMRLSGTINQFIDFSAGLYKMSRFYKIESFTLKPLREEQMQIFLELKGYYKIKSPAPPEEEPRPEEEA